MNKFQAFGLLESLNETLSEMMLQSPTEIQKMTIPALLKRESLVGLAETGSGKTLAYVLPMLHLLKTLEINGNEVSSESSPRGLVLVPTRDLGEQVAKVFKRFTHQTRVRVRSALGGMAMDLARRNTTGTFEILIATPGRLLQLNDQGLIDLIDIRFLVIDEADQMLDEGFYPITERIVSSSSSLTQMALFTATLSAKVDEIIEKLFAQAQMYRTKGVGKTVETLTTENLIIADGQRLPYLKKLLAKKVEGGTLIFANTREQCDKISDDLKELNIPHVMYRGELEKSERRNNLRQFKDGKVPVMVATDLAGRGLDIPHVGRVINYHLPKQVDNYIHRAGRTARAGREGVVINFVTERDLPVMEQAAQKSQNRVPKIDPKAFPRVAHRLGHKDKAPRGSKVTKGKKPKAQKNSDGQAVGQSSGPKGAGKSALGAKSGSALSQQKAKVSVPGLKTEKFAGRTTYTLEPEESRSAGGSMGRSTGGSKSSSSRSTQKDTRSSKSGGSSNKPLRKSGLNPNSLKKNPRDLMKAYLERSKKRK